MTPEEITQLVEKIQLEAKEMADLEVSANMGYYSQEELDQAWLFFKSKVEEEVSKY